MTFYVFNDDWMWLTVMMEATEKVTEQSIRDTLRWLIEQEVEMGNDPWEQVTAAELREADWGEMPLAVRAPKEEFMDDPEEIEELVDKLMRTQEVETAVRWMRGLGPEDARRSYEPWSTWTDPATGEEYDTEQPMLTEVLSGITLTEHDSGAGAGLYD